MDSFKLKEDTIIVFDFDGTMGHLFANYDLSSIVMYLHQTMKTFDIDFDISYDAFDVFKVIIDKTHDDILKREKALIVADTILTNAEIEAVETCKLINGVNEVIPYLIKRGYRIGIATNNSKECVLSFLNKYCDGLDLMIVGRNRLHPELMKPNTWALDKVIKDLDGLPINTIFIGDNKRDYICAKKVGCKFLGLVSNEKKKEGLKDLLMPSQMVVDYFDLLHVLL